MSCLYRIFSGKASITLPTLFNSSAILPHHLSKIFIQPGVAVVTVAVGNPLPIVTCSDIASPLSMAHNYLQSNKQAAVMTINQMQPNITVASLLLGSKLQHAQLARRFFIVDTHSSHLGGDPVSQLLDKHNLSPSQVDFWIQPDMSSLSQFMKHANSYSQKGHGILLLNDPVRLSEYEVILLRKVN